MLIAVGILEKYSNFGLNVIKLTLLKELFLKWTSHYRPYLLPGTFIIHVSDYCGTCFMGV
jgi:hypothetical protein